MTCCAGIRGWIAVITLMVIAAIFARPALAQTQGGNYHQEQIVKAAYLFHFLGLVDWPASSFSSPQSPLAVGVMGNDALADALARLAAKRAAQGRPIVVTKLSRPTERAAVHLLYVDDRFRGQLPSLFSALEGQAVLTVTHSAEALTFGAIINFINVDGSLRFEISAAAAQQAKLSISSRLLAVSYRLTPGSPKFSVD